MYNDIYQLISQMNKNVLQWQTQNWMNKMRNTNAPRYFANIPW